MRTVSRSQVANAVDAVEEPLPPRIQEGLIPPSTSTGSPQSSIDRPRKRLGFAKPIEESDHYCCDDRMNLRKLYRTRRVGL
jgi:hypothetical protein